MSASLGEAILSAQSITRSYGAQPVLSDISLTVHEGERIGLIGRNGSGKSTLLKILCGRDEPDSGLVTRRQRLRVGMLDQHCQIDREKTIGAVLEEPTHEIRALLAEYQAVTRGMAETPSDSKEQRRFREQYTYLHHELEIANAWNLSYEIDRISAALALPEPGRIVGTLSGGELRRLDLAATLLAHPDVLLLDEPTNHIDTKSVEWIESFLINYMGSCILVTHDRYFLEQVVNRIVEIEFNRLFSFPGNYEKFLEYKTQIRQVEAQTERGRQAVLRRELAWIQRGPRARTTKAKARIRSFDELAAQEGPLSHAEIEFEIPPPPRLGKRIVDAEEMTFAFDKKVLFSKFTFIFQKGMRVGVIGPNGCGKTTLLRALMGQLELKKGRVLIGETTQFLYVDQGHEEIKPEQSILDFVSNGAHYFEVNGRRLYVPSYLERFLFDAGTIHMPMRNLSGGERNRIELAKKLLRGGNFLVLDEPTNDLDLPTLRVLEEAIRVFDGCALLVSHDRYFLNRLCTHLFVFREDGPVLIITGNYDDYLIWRDKQTAAAPSEKVAKPKAASKPRDPLRLTYKEQQELAGMEQAIEAAEAEVAGIEGVIHQPGFYERPYPVVQETLNAYTAAKERVDALYARWHDLEQRSRGQGSGASDNPGA